MGREEREPKRETRCASPDALVAISIGAKDCGIRSIEYPAFQAFAHLLQQQEGLFPDYIFNGSAWPGVEFPQSKEMVEDLNRETSLGFLRELTDPLAYELTSQAEGRRDQYIEGLETGGVLTFDELRIMAGKLLSNPDTQEELLKQSYQLYIDGLGKHTVDA